MLFVLKELKAVWETLTGTEERESEVLECGY